MSNIHNAKDYKLAKVIVGDLETILKVVGLTIRGLEPYKHYKPVGRLLEKLKAEKAILQSHFQKYRQVKNDKGKVK